MRSPNGLFERADKELCYPTSRLGFMVAWRRQRPGHRSEAPGSLIADDSVSRADGMPDDSDFTGSGRLALLGTNGYLSLPPRLISWLSNATFEAWVSWNGPATSVWQRVWDFSFSDCGTNVVGEGTNYVIFSPSRGCSELPGFEETTVNPFGTDTDQNALSSANNFRTGNTPD